MYQGQGLYSDIDIKAIYAGWVKIAQRAYITKQYSERQFGHNSQITIT